MIRIGNARNGDKGIYIGRPMRGAAGSPLCNPFKMTTKTPEDRANVIRLFREHLNKEIAAGNPAILKALRQIKEASRQGDVTLVCWCSPLSCHGSVIQEVVEAMD